MISPELIHSLADLAWPLLLAVALVVLLPEVRRVIASRDFTVRVGNTEITVQQASDQLSGGLDDLRDQVTLLKTQISDDPHERLPTRSLMDSPSYEQLTNVLWVDDYPDNNVYEIATLVRRGVAVTRARSTQEALEALSSRHFDAVVSDMGRVEGGVYRPDAGLELLTAMRTSDFGAPILFYSTAPTLARTHQAIEAAGAVGATSSGTELLELLASLSGQDS
jgi:CheY-like chemotaxis protein